MRSVCVCVCVCVFLGGEGNTGVCQVCRVALHACVRLAQPPLSLRSCVMCVRACAEYHFLVRALDGQHTWGMCCSVFKDFWRVLGAHLGYVLQCVQRLLGCVAVCSKTFGVCWVCLEFLLGCVGVCLKTFGMCWSVFRDFWGVLECV